MGAGAMGGGAFGQLIRRAYENLPEGAGGTGPTVGGPAFPGQTQMSMPLQSQGMNYGQLGPYNTLAQDMVGGGIGNFGFGFGGQPFSYEPGFGARGRYIGNPYAGQQSWPGAGYGGMPGRYNQPGRGGGSGYGGYFGGSMYGQGQFSGFPYLGGPGSYRSPGAVAQDLRGRTSPFGIVGRTPGTPTGIRLPGQQMATTTGSNQADLAASAMGQDPRSVQPAQQV